MRKRVIAPRVSLPLPRWLVLIIMLSSSPYLPSQTMLLVSSEPFAHLVLSSLEQPLRHLVLLDDVDVGAPAGQGISVDGVQKGLGDGFEQLIRALYYQSRLARKTKKEETRMTSSLFPRHRFPRR